jgi:hypothetical protein
MPSDSERHHHQELDVPSVEEVLYGYGRGRELPPERVERTVGLLRDRYERGSLRPRADLSSWFDTFDDHLAASAPGDDDDE